jgi:NDP-sugar pyrophosphorylase family protein
MVRSFPNVAVVLAGGLGTRLRTTIADRPKVLAPAAGRPFLDYVLEHLAQQRVREVILCVSYLAEQVKAFAGDGQRWGLVVRYSEEQTPLGTGGALRQASARLYRPFFALNGDTLFAVDLRELWEVHSRLDALATVAILRTTEGRVRGCVKLDPDGKIVSFDEKPEQAQESLVSGGVYVLERQALARIQPGQVVSLEREIFPHLATDGKLAGLVCSAYFADIGTPESLSAFEQDVISGRSLGVVP